MKKILQYLGRALLVLISLVIVTIVILYVRIWNESRKAMQQALPLPQVLTIEGFRFRDLNRNGKLDPYEDRRAPIDLRVEDLLQQMTLEEKAGTLFIPIAHIGPEGRLFDRLDLTNPISLISPPNAKQVLINHINSVNIQFAHARDIAHWTNAMQRLAERSRLGIPMTISSDPRHAFSFNPMAGFGTEGFSRWPEPLGFGALRDTNAIRTFAQMAAHEYRAVGIHLALHPMADLATEPRWPRINGTFGEDAELTAALVYQYIRGFQGDSIGPNSVACMTKHFSGGGPQREGLDPHFAFGKDQVYPGNNFAYHLIPFRAAIAAGTAAMMPYYGIPVDQSTENVGFAFNKQIITSLLRDSMGFKGVVCSDWSILTDKKILGITVFQNTGWGLEDKTPEERIIRAMEAGVDQFGGEEETFRVVELVHQGKLSVSRIDASVRRILRLKLSLGLFDRPFVDLGNLDARISLPQAMETGKLIQGKAMVLIDNKRNLLPIAKGMKIYAEHIPQEMIRPYGTPVQSPQEADIAILRINTPFRRVSDHPMAQFFHHGDLDFEKEELDHILSICREVPTIVDLYLDRPAVIPEIAREAAAVLADFGAEHDVLMKVLTGMIQPEGRLPFELPSSMTAVRNQKEDLPRDSENPLYPFGHGVRLPSGQHGTINR